MVETARLGRVDNNDDRPYGSGFATQETTKENYGVQIDDTAECNSLDLFSTSPTYSAGCAAFCINHAPLFAYKKHGSVYGIVQGCCNSWTCPRCGIMRAKQEYGRIVEGCRTLSEDNQLWFITVTCRGRDMSKKEADEKYGVWTNKLLDAWRLQSKRTHQKWAYVQVTERQKRGHPHSHILTTFCPTDIISHDWKANWVQVNGRRCNHWVSAHRSQYIEHSCVRAGLGAEYDISPIRQAEAVSRYVAKYMFKDSVFNTVWPKGWKRVRYSQSFPKLPERKTDAFILMNREDWEKLSRVAVSVIAKDEFCLIEARARLRGSDVILIDKIVS